jgi:3-(3-hydroxy-phenyl)propionate hydroxylase
VICVPDPVEAAARDEAIAASFDGDISAVPALPGITSGLIAAGSPLAGEVFPQGESGEGWFDDVYGVGWRLVTIDADRSGFDPELANWFETIGGTVIGDLEAADLVAWFEGRDVRWALQRPDFSLFGTATNLNEASALVSELRRQLGGGAPVS